MKDDDNKIGWSYLEKFCGDNNDITNGLWRVTITLFIDNDRQNQIRKISQHMMSYDNTHHKLDTGLNPSDPAGKGKNIFFLIETLPLLVLAPTGMFRNWPCDGALWAIWPWLHQWVF